MVQEHEGRFCGREGLACRYRVWLPDQAPKAALALIHGVCEHSGRYRPLAEELARHGCAVYALDLRGHGRSDGERILIRRFDDHLDDAEQLLGVVRARHPDSPLFLMGHSMGGAIAARLTIRRRPEIRGLILSAAPVRVAGHLFPVLRHLAGLASRVFPRLRLIRVGTSRLSRDPAVIADFKQDPLVYNGKFPVRTGAEILRAGRELNKELHALNLPVLVLHGTGDWITDPRGSKELYQRASSTDKTLKLYEGLYHDLFHEPEWRQVTADVVAWVEERVERPAR
jgi:alpha-beta hydrolase superfamily lysophospholipase